MVLIINSKILKFGYKFLMININWKFSINKILLDIKMQINR